MPILYDPWAKVAVHDDSLTAPVISSDDDGLYLVRRHGGTSTYVKLDSSVVAPLVLPEYPESDGAYVLTVTMDNGAATLSWEAAAE